MQKIIVWGYWVKNFGDDLFLISLNETIKKIGNAKIYICCEKKYRQYYKKMELKIITNNNILYKILHKICIFFNKPDPYFLMSKNKIFVMLGGSLFSENKDANIEKRQILNLKYAVNNAKKSFIIGSNFGPYKTQEFYYNYLNIFKNVEDICFRDNHSAGLFEDKLKNIRCCCDIALEGIWDTDNNIKNSICKDDKYITFSIIDLQNRKRLSNYLNDYENKIIEICNYYIKKNKKIAFLVFCEKEGDKVAINRITEKITKKDSIEIIEYKDINSITEIINNSYKIYATRFHAIMMALYYKKKIVPFVYNEKTINALSTYSKKFIAYNISNFSNIKTTELINMDQIIKIENIKNGQFSSLIKSIKEEK